MFQTYICLKNIYLEIAPYSIRTYICPYSMYVYSEKMVYGEPLEEGIFTQLNIAVGISLTRSTTSTLWKSISIGDGPTTSRITLYRIFQRKLCIAMGRIADCRTKMRIRRYRHNSASGLLLSYSCRIVIYFRNIKIFHIMHLQFSVRGIWF